MKFIKIICIVLVTTCIHSIVFTQEIVWKKLASLPQPCAGGGAAVMGNKIYFVASGHAARTSTKDFYVYDIATDKWEQLADIPASKGNMAVEEISGKLFVIGGDPFTKTNFEYNPETNTWDSLSPMPTGRQHIDGAVVNNKIYIIGGLTSWTSFTKKTEVYDAATDTWEEKAPIPTLRNNAATAVLDSLIYVIGGAGTETDIWKTIATVECYNTNTDTWTTKSNLPNVVFKPTALTVNGKMFLLGGQNVNGQSLKSVFVYDEANDKWKNTTPLPKINCFAGYAAVGNKIYVIGGTTSDPGWTYYSDVYEGTVIGPFDYFGQTPPGDTAVIFAPGLISKPNNFESDIAFSQNGKELYYTSYSDTGGGIFYSKLVNYAWTQPEKVPFSFSGNVMNPDFSYNGQKLYCTVWENNTSNIFVVERNEEVWGEPKLLPFPVNTDERDDSYTETVDGIGYLTSNRQGGIGGLDIWKITPQTDSSYKAENMGVIINSGVQDFSSCVAPDGSYLIFTSHRSGKYSIQDLWISFHKGNDEWTSPINMEMTGAQINVVNFNQHSPSLSPDGKYLFFSRENSTNDQRDVYWVSTNITDTLKKIALSTVSIRTTNELPLNVYPNPTNGLLQISLGTTQVKKAIAEIYNTEGKHILTTYLSEKSTIDLSNNAKGLYHLKINADGEILHRKVCLK